MPRNFIPLAEYAAKKGLAENAIRDRIKSGSITSQAVKREGDRVFIDALQADLDFEFLGDVSKAENYSETKDDLEHVDFSSPQNAMEVARKNAALFKQAKITTEEIRARKLELEIKIKEKKLLDADEVRKRLIKIVAEIRDGILNVPGRVAPVLAPMTDNLEIEKKLYEELNLALVSLSRLGEATNGSEEMGG